MNTRDLIEVISSESGLTKLQTDKALNSLAANLTIALKKDEEVYIAGIGTFTTGRIKDNENTDPNNTDNAAGNSGTTRIPQFQPGTELLSAVS